MQQRRPEGEKGDDRLVDITPEGMLLPGGEISLHVEMYEAVGQRRRHLEHGRPVFRSIAGGPDEHEVTPEKSHITVTSKPTPNSRTKVKSIERKAELGGQTEPIADYFKKETEDLSTPSAYKPKEEFGPSPLPSASTSKSLSFEQSPEPDITRRGKDKGQIAEALNPKDKDLKSEIINTYIVLCREVVK